MEEKSGCACADDGEDGDTYSSSSCGRRLTTSPSWSSSSTLPLYTATSDPCSTLIDGVMVQAEVRAVSMVLLL